MRKSEIEWLRFKAVLTGDTLVEYQVHWTIKDIKGQERNYCCYFLELEQADNFFVKKLGEKNTRYCLVLKRTLSPNESPSVRVETIHGLAHGKFYPNE